MDIQKKGGPGQGSHKIRVVKKVQAEHKYWIGGYAFLALGCIAVHYLFRIDVLKIPPAYRQYATKITLGGFFVFVVLLTGRVIEMIIAKKSHVRAIRYNLLRVIRLVTVLLIVMVVISFLFENWYTAAVSLGLISLILGFALQTPISSFIAWLYIIFRNPYRVGDRIQIDTFKGDVVEINYLDTTLWEFGGDYLTNDMPSGRLIRFPNSLVLQSAIFNYSWNDFPYIWNEIPFHVAYESDLNYVATTLKEVTKKELGPGMAENIRKLKLLIKQTPVDELEIKEYPYVMFRTNANTWVEVLVTYLVEPREAAGTRSRILKKALEELLKQPGKVMFPNSNAR